MNKMIIIALSVIVGIALLIIAGVYFATPANHLPAFFPGFDATTSKTHLKHGIGAALLGVAAFIFAWFQSGKKKAVKPSEPSAEQKE